MAGRAGEVRTRLRLVFGSAFAMGHGKAELLESIGRTGSISAAARAMGMSYRRAWLLVDDMNRCLREPVVDAATGGRGGGGARLTPFGRDVLQRFRALEATAAGAIRGDLEEFSRLLRVRGNAGAK